MDNCYISNILSKRSFQYVVDKLNDETLNVIDIWKKYSSMNCVNQVGSALTDLRPPTLNACWKAVWPECVKSRDFVISNTTKFPYIKTMRISQLIRHFS